MAARIPTFADLGFNDPNQTTPLVQYPQSDPVATARSNLGADLQQFGGALLKAGEYQQEKQNEMGVATSTIDFMNRFIPIHKKITQSSDPDEIAALRQQYQDMLQTSANAIPDKLTRQKWMASHARTLIEANADADERLTAIGKDRFKAQLMGQFDAATRNAAGAPEALDSVLLGIDGAMNAAVSTGQFGAVEGYKLGRERRDEAVRGAADTLIEQGRPDQAIAILDKYRSDVDPMHADVLRRRAQAKNIQVLGDQAAQYGMGLGPEPSAGGGPVRKFSGDAGDRIAATLKSRGWSDAAIEGALNNSITESSLNPNAAGAAGEKGLFQFHPASHIEPFTQAYKGDWSPEAQASYVADVVEKSIPGYAQSADPRQATASFLRGFEKPKDQSDVQLNNRYANSGASRAIMARLGSGAAAEATGAPADTGSMLAVGDSIAAHLIRKAGVGGQEDPTKIGSYRAGDTAVSGWSPEKILSTVIPGIPDDQIRGKNVVLSTGASNDPGQLDLVPKQIAALKSRGAASVTVMGVGTAARVQGVNDKLAQIAEANGASFAGPLRKVAGDGIHSSDPKSELAAVQQVMTPGTAGASIGTPEGTDVSGVAQGGASGATGGLATPSNRTGLPTLEEQFSRIDRLNIPPEAKQYAKQKASIEYNKREADALRSERIAAQKVRAQDEALENEIIKDASPSNMNPQWTADKVQTDPRLSREAKLRMLSFLSSAARKAGDKDENTYGTGFYDAFQKIHLPDGDPNKITTPEQLYSRIGPGGDLTVSGLEKLRGEIVSKRTPEGEAASAMKSQFLEKAHKDISGKDDLLHIRDKKGEEQFLRFQAQFFPAYEEGLRQGKSPTRMLDPDSPDYLGKMIPQFIRPRDQWISDMLDDGNSITGAAPTSTTAGKKSANPADYRDPNSLIEAVRNNWVDYDAGVAEARRRGYLPPPVQAPLR